MTGGADPGGPVLILGGTGEGRQLAAALTDAGAMVVSSLAGATSSARRLEGEVRVGGFGGAAGLGEYLRARQVVAVVDATHPYASRISRHAAAACAETGVPLLRLERPGWATRPDAASWVWVDSSAEAVDAARRLAGGGTVLLTVGRNTLAEYAGLAEAPALPVVARVAEAADDVLEILPRAWEVLAARGPYALAEEEALMRERGVTVLVTKDSGGAATVAKLDAAARLGVAVVMLRRPDGGRGEAAGGSVPAVATVAETGGQGVARAGGQGVAGAGGQSVATVAEAVAWVLGLPPFALPSAR